MKKNKYPDLTKACSATIDQLRLQGVVDRHREQEELEVELLYQVIDAQRKIIKNLVDAINVK